MAPLTAEEEDEYREHAIHGSGAYYDTSDIRRLLATLDAARSDMAALVDENHHLNHERLDAARSVPDNAAPRTHLRGDLPPLDLDGIEMRWASQWNESDDGEVRAWRDDVAALIDEVRRLRQVSNGYFEEMVRRTPGSVPDNAALREAVYRFLANWQRGYDPHVAALQEAYDAAPASPARLDVERLARAIFDVTVNEPGLLSDVDMLNDPTQGDPRPAAKAIAEAYLASAEEASRG